MYVPFLSTNQVVLTWPLSRLDLSQLVKKHLHISTPHVNNLCVCHYVCVGLGAYMKILKCRE
jgi:hypothetical protein